MFWRQSTRKHFVCNDNWMFYASRISQGHTFWTLNFDGEILASRSKKHEIFELASHWYFL